MSINSGLFTSNSDSWETPQWLFDDLNKEFNFTLDVCATPENAKCERYFTEEQDGLIQYWEGNCWMNPPYGRQIGKWVKKADFERKFSAKNVVCLLPSRTDTRWFHDYIWDKERHQPREGVEVRLLAGRLKFGGSKSSAPFPSMIVIFKKVGT